MMELGYGSITTHYVKNDVKYCKELDNNGTIHNNYYSLRYGSKNKFGVFFGEDSVCNKIRGSVNSIYLSDSFDFVFGGYNNNYKRVKSIDLGFARTNAFLFNNQITPVLGLNYRIELYKYKEYKLQLNNILSLGITTHNITFDF